MNTNYRGWSLILLVAVCWGLASQSPVVAAPYTIAYTDGANAQTLYVQGFNTTLGATPNPAIAAGAAVYLKQFQFFKSSMVDNQSNIQLAILNNIFPSTPTVNNLTTTSAPVVGLSSNTVSSTASIAAGAPIAFTFNNLPLVYGNDYAAMFVNVGAGGTLTPVRVSTLSANYVETPAGSGSFHPATNYGTEAQFQYATSNFISATGFFNTFTFAGDANFSASLDTVPEPSTCVLAATGIGLIAIVRRRRRSR